MTTDLTGKVAYVTGAARGQGRRACPAAQAGADIDHRRLRAGGTTSATRIRHPEDLADFRLVEMRADNVLAARVDVRDHDGQQRVVAEPSNSSAASTSSWPMPG